MMIPVKSGRCNLEERMPKSMFHDSSRSQHEYLISYLGGEICKNFEVVINFLIFLTRYFALISNVVLYFAKGLSGKEKKK